MARFVFVEQISASLEANGAPWRLRNLLLLLVFLGTHARSVLGVDALSPPQGLAEVRIRVETGHPVLNHGRPLVLIDDLVAEVSRIVDDQ